MKNLKILLLFLLPSISLSQPLNRFFETADGSINILGQASLERLKSEPFNEWYETNYNEYEVDTVTLNSFDMPDSVTIFMGTWCGDSKREVPRFVKGLEAVEFDFNKLKIICLNTGFQNYKQAPEREEAGQNIHRVPTFILHAEDQKEIGRIVEEPVVSLEKDLKDILEGNPYETYYAVANDLIQKLQEKSVKELRKGKSELLKAYQGQTVSEYELNTYGYVLWTSFQLVEAEFVFELNTWLHPESTTSIRPLANLQTIMGKDKAAIASVKRGLKIDPDNEALLNMKSSLEEGD